MIEKLELNHLRVLSALYKHGTVSAASESLDVSQQAVSLQLKRIREILGDTLFVRTGHGMVPTAYGQLIQPHVQQLLALIHAMPMPRSIPLADMERTLSISATDHAQRIIVGHLIRELRRVAPKVKLKISNIESADLVRRMQEGEISMALTSSGYVPEGLHSIPLFTERYVCVAGTPLTSGADTLPLKSLVAHDFLVVSPAVPSFDGSAGAGLSGRGCGVASWHQCRRSSWRSSTCANPTWWPSCRRGYCPATGCSRCRSKSIHPAFRWLQPTIRPQTRTRC